MVSIGGAATKAIGVADSTGTACVPVGRLGAVRVLVAHFPDGNLPITSIDTSKDMAISMVT